MKAISLWQPWASLLVSGQKRIETRSWPFRFAMPRLLAIHTAKHFTRTERELCTDCKVFRDMLASIGINGPSDLPFGCIVGVVTVTSVFQFKSPLDRPNSPEIYFGDYALGRWGWRTENNRTLITPIPCVGLQGPFDWQPPAELLFTDGSRLDPEVANAIPSGGPVKKTKAPGLFD